LKSAWNSFTYYADLYRAADEVEVAEVTSLYFDGPDAHPDAEYAGSTA
jgi:hypothetical protein